MLWRLRNLRWVQIKGDPHVTDMLKYKKLYLDISSIMEMQEENTWKLATALKKNVLSSGIDAICPFSHVLSLCLVYAWDPILPTLVISQVLLEKHWTCRTWSALHWLLLWLHLETCCKETNQGSTMGWDQGPHTGSQSCSFRGRL